MLRTLFALCLMAMPVAAQDVADLTARPGWEVHATDLTHADLVASTRAAITANGMGIVTQAGPTGAAANRGVTIPGNTVIGAFNNAFAVRILRLSTSAMIHAPIRLYVTENTDGTATLSYIRPSHLLAPYFDDAAPDLAVAASELDHVFTAIATAATAR